MIRESGRGRDCDAEEKRRSTIEKPRSMINDRRRAIERKRRSRVEPENSSSMRKGSRFRSAPLEIKSPNNTGMRSITRHLYGRWIKRCYLPMLLLTLAPTPSCCDLASTFLATCLGFSKLGVSWSPILLLLQML